MGKLSLREGAQSAQPGRPHMEFQLQHVHAVSGARVDTLVALFRSHSFLPPWEMQGPEIAHAVCTG